MFREKNMDHSHHDDHEALFAAEWTKSQENFLVKGLNANVSPAELLGAREDFPGAFKKGGAENILTCLKCSDGRVNDNPEISGDEKLGLAGEGILFGKAELQKFVQDNAGKIKTVTSHEHCGAAALKFAQMQASGEVLPSGVTTSDELGKHFAQQLAQMMGTEYRHIGEKEFSSPVHNERLFVIDGTAKFNPAQMSDFPPRFMSAALGLGADSAYVAKEAEVLAGISLGDHGFNQRFTADNPFHIMVIGKDQAEVDKSLESLKNFVEKSGGRVRASGLVAPERV